jgi:hypothetical protein
MTMSKLEMFVVRVEGDAAAIAEAFEMVRKQLAPDSISAEAVEKIESKPAALLNGSAPREKIKGSALPAPSNEGKKSEPARTLKAANGGPYVQAGSMQEKALAFIRESHYGVTSDEIHQQVKCATVQSAYQICMELEKKQLIQRTGAGAWKAINA